jgi:hypothetical protein
MTAEPNPHYLRVLRASACPLHPFQHYDRHRRGPAVRNVEPRADACLFGCHAAEFPDFSEP